MTTWTVVITAGVATFAIRYVFIGLFGRVEMPAWLEHALAYVAPAVLAAISIPGILAPDGSVALWHPFLPAAAISAVTAWKTKSLGVAILAGLVALWGLRALT